MTQQHAQISHKFLPVPLKWENIIISYPLWIELKQGDSFEHCLIIYLLKYWLFLTKKKLCTAALNK